MTLVEALLLVMRLKTCIPSYHERFSLILDLEDSTCSAPFTKHFLFKLHKLLREQVPYSVEKFYVFGEVPELGEELEKFETSLEGMVHFVHLSKFKLRLVSEEFDLMILEKKFGGRWMIWGSTGRRGVRKMRRRRLMRIAC
jgi:hypothetical protein